MKLIEVYTCDEIVVPATPAVSSDADDCHSGFAAAKLDYIVTWWHTVGERVNQLVEGAALYHGARQIQSPDVEVSIAPVVHVVDHGRGVRGFLVAGGFNFLVHMVEDPVEILVGTQNAF